TAPESAPRRADAFEAALLGRDTVTLRQRLDLIAVSARLEGRHPRPETTRDGGVLFGHELGHFWGDFLPARLEARLFRVLSRIDDPQALVACLELCEAAMEADIVDLLRAWTTGEGAEPGHSRTVIDTIAETGPNAVARARGKATDWYVLLEADPAGLVDAVVFDAHTRNVEPGSVLIGESDQRDRHTAALTRTLHAGLDFIHRGVDNDEPFLDYQPVRLLCEALARDLPREGRDFDAVLADVESNVTAWSIGQSHRSYLAFPDSGNAVAGLAGAVLAKFLNQNLIALDRSAPAATFVEAQVIEWLRELIGYDTIALTEFRGVKDVAGLWTTGGHLSNHVAMLTALGHAFPQARSNGLLGLAERPGVVMAGAIAHYSHSDAAFHLGLGWESIIKVDAQPGFTTDPAAVDKALADPPDGVKPFMVVGVA
ncbi:MAG: pyridoxal-dependent decarboxylase, partial [Stackebrandtia sp.]